MPIVNPTAPKNYRHESEGCLNGVVTYKSTFYCDPKDGPVDGSGTDTDSKSFFYQIVDGNRVVVDWGTASVGWEPGKCPTAKKFAVGVITNPDDPEAVDVPVVLTIAPDGTITYTSLIDGKSTVTPGAGEEFRPNADGGDAERISGCVKDADGTTIHPSAEAYIVTDEDAEEVSRTILDSTTGAVITLAEGETFGPCSGGLPSHAECGCIVNETAGSVVPATKEIPRDSDTGLLDHGKTTYKDDAGTVLTLGAGDVFRCGPCPEIISCG